MKGKSLNMSGPFPLTSEFVTKNIPETTGNYALGNDEGLIFRIAHIGRSDYNLKANLLMCAVKGRYKYFKFSVAQSTIEAYYKECQNYHDFGDSEKIRHLNHPTQPRGENIECPYCGGNER